MCNKYSLKLLDHAKRFATDEIRTASKREIQKTAKATRGLIGNKNSDKITRISKASPEDNPETNEKEILTKRFISPQLRLKITDNLGLIT